MVVIDHLLATNKKVCWAVKLSTLFVSLYVPVNVNVIVAP